MTDTRVRWGRTEPNSSSKQGAQAAEQSMHHGGSFRTYMQFKNIKLQEQFEAQALQTTVLSDLFQGVSIHVNGLTVPSHQELKQIMALNGGRFETYYHRNRVTHIICNNLPDTKLKQLAHARDPVPIVKPDWIVASLRAGHLLPLKDFMLQPIRDIPGQRQLFEFRTHQPQALTPTELYPALQQQRQQGDQHVQQQHHQVQNVGHGTGLQQPQEQDQQHLQQLAQQLAQQPLQQQEWQGQQYKHQQQLHQISMQDAQAQGMAQQQESWQRQQHGQQDDAEQQPLHTLQGQPQQQQCLDAPTSSEQQQSWHLHQQQSGPSASHHAAQATTAGAAVSVGGVDTSLAAAQATAAKLRATCDLLKGPPKSSADDPEGFVGSFFRSSRLHFIGTWKARIEALMAQQQQQQPAPPAAVGRKIGVLGQQQQQGRGADNRTIVHLDMDCFFAAVAVVGRPEFVGKPLAVCHSNNEKGSAEVSSANYEARAFGIRAGRSMSEAKSRYPDLLVVPYEFDKYEEISEQVYRILLRHTPVIQPLSCDEAYMDLTGVTSDPQAVVAQIRADIQQTTGCTASAGIGPNMLLARLATKRAKPNGQALIRADEARQVLGDLEVSELPGVGWRLKSKLAGMGITHVRQVWSMSKEVLMRKLGAQIGLSLWHHSHGIDGRPVEPPKARRSVGAGVTWGVRFSSDEDAQRFLKDVSKEVAARLSQAAVRAKCITLKVKRRQAGAPEPSKFLGSGVCDNISRSVTLGGFVSSANELYEQAVLLLVALKLPPEEVRGLGITVSKLDSESASHTARPSGPAPAKVPPGKRTVYDASRSHEWWTAPQQQQANGLEQQLDGIAAQQQQQQASTSHKRSWSEHSEGHAAAAPAAADSPQADAAAATTQKRFKAGKPGSSLAAVGLQRTLHGLLGQQQQQHTHALLQQHVDSEHHPEHQLSEHPAFQQQQQHDNEDQGGPHGTGQPAPFAAVAQMADDSSSYSSDVTPDTSPSQAALLVSSQPCAAVPCAGPQAVAAASGGAAANGMENCLSTPLSAKRQLFGSKVASHSPSPAAEHKPADAAAAPAAADSGSNYDMAAGMAAGIAATEAQAVLLAAAAGGATVGQAIAAVAASAAGAQQHPSSTPIAALPPMSQLDPDVLAALPADVRRELQAAYGITAAQQARRHHPAGSRGQPLSPFAGQKGGNRKKQQQQQWGMPGRVPAQGSASTAAAAAGEAVRPTAFPAATSAGNGCGNWLKGFAAAAAASKREQQQPRYGGHHGFLAAGKGKTARPSNQQQQQPHRPEVLIHMNQVDPDVLAELPPELQQELRAALVGKPKPRITAAGDDRGHDAMTAAAGLRGPAVGLKGAAAAATAAGVQQHQLSTAAAAGLAGVSGAGLAVGLTMGHSSKLAAVEIGHMNTGQLQQLQLFADEPVSAILLALTQSLNVLVPFTASAPSGSKATSATDPAATAAASGDGSRSTVTLSLDVLLTQDAIASMELRTKLLVLCEHLAQWMLEHDNDLADVRRVLRLVHQAGQQRQSFKALAERLVGVVQQHIQHKYGFELRL